MGALQSHWAILDCIAVEANIPQKLSVLGGFDCLNIPKEFSLAEQPPGVF